MFMAFAALFSSVFEFLLFVGALVVLYQVFLSDWISSKKEAVRESKGKLGAVEKIAQIKLVSDDAKDIEKFVTDNAAYLSGPTVTKLAARIESLHIDTIIRDDEQLNKRIAALPQPEELEDEEEEVHAKTARS